MTTTTARSGSERRFRRNARLPLVLAVTLLAAVLIGPLLTGHDFLSQDITRVNQAPGAQNWLGTDDLGRDVLTRVIAGGRTALYIALGVNFLALLIGVTIGAIAGYSGRRVDATLMWLADMTMSVPSLLLVVVINTSLRPQIANLMEALYQSTLNPVFRLTVYADLALLMVCLALVLWPEYARLVRAQILSIRSRDYVRAAHAIGLGPWRVLTGYVLPNAIGPLIVAVSAGLGTAVVLESAFSFLGVGVQPPIPSWGRMIADGLRAWRSAPHLLIVPAITLGYAAITFSLLGDALAAALDPRRAQR